MLAARTITAPGARSRAETLIHIYTDEDEWA
nr:MAG TPA: hypothetical protein [Caudoviricetes sp.]